MSKIFYDHLIIIEEIIAIIDKHSILPSERKAILAHVDELLHNAIMDVILTHLPKKDHEEFLHAFMNAPGSKELLSFLQDRIDVNIEKAILKRVDSVKKTINQLINEDKKAGQKE